MNKKLKLYTALLVAAIITSVVTGTFHYHSAKSFIVSDQEYGLNIEPIPAEFATIDSIDGRTITHNHATYDVEVNVMPKASDGKAIISHANGQTCKIDMQKIKISVPADGSVFKSSIFYIVGICLLLTAAIGIYLLIIVFRIIKDIRKGEVFVTKTSTQIETLGKLLIGYNIISLIMAYGITLFAQHHFTIANYYITNGDSLDLNYIIIGLVLMVISQILLMGKELKEEQELTI